MWIVNLWWRQKFIYKKCWCSTERAQVNMALRCFPHKHGNIATEGNPNSGLCPTHIEWLQVFFIDQNTIESTAHARPLNSLQQFICTTPLSKIRPGTNEPSGSAGVCLNKIFLHMVHKVSAATFQVSVSAQNVILKIKNNWFIVPKYIL